MNSAIPAQASRRFDVLRLPVLGSFLRWRYSRFVLQFPLLLVAVLSVYDGFTGRQIAGVNVAGVSVWVHYRGLVALALAVFGNLFCAACPLMLTRGPAKVLSRFMPKFAWPRALRNKYFVLGLTVLYLYGYEQFDWWASPFATAWLIVGYFSSALLVDTFFPAGTFCKYVCPLGNFNFALSGASPTQITATDPSVCDSCEGKYCLNGREETATARAPILGNRADHVMLELPMLSSPAKIGSFPGCETDLFVPTMTSSTDCTLCLNCARACPYDNVALSLRSPAFEAEFSKPKSDWALFVTVLAWAGLVNAFAMIPPYFTLAAWLSGVLGTRNEALLLAIIQITGIGSGVALTWLAARASRGSGSSGSLRDWTPVLLPMALALWGGHYLYHFVTGSSALWPNTVIALQRLGLPLPNLPIPGVSRRDDIFIYQVILTYLGLGLSAWAAWKRASRAKNLGALVPQLALMLVFVALTLLIFSQPMQARGSLL